MDLSSVSINDYYTLPVYQENRFMFQWISEKLTKDSKTIYKTVKYYICCQFCLEPNYYEPI